MPRASSHILENEQPKLENIFLSSEKNSYTYGNLNTFKAFFCDILSQNSLYDTSLVAFLCESCDALVFSVAACWELGVPFIPLDPKLTQQEIESQLEVLNPSIVFCDSRNIKRVDRLVTFQIDETFLDMGLNFEKSNSEYTTTKNIQESEIFGYFFTSGTTASPKIVPLKRRQMYAAAKSSAKNLRPEPNHLWLLCLPLNHIGGISIILRTLIYRTGIYRSDSFNEYAIKNLLSDNPKIQAVSLVPTMLERLLKQPDFNIHKSFKAILLGGGPSTEHSLQKCIDKGIPIISSYGMTETCAQVVAHPILTSPQKQTLLSSVGKPLENNHVQITDEQGNKLTENKSGLIWLKGSQVFDGYFNYKNNDSLFDKDGWFNTGDFGHLNSAGYLFIDNRRTDLIVSGGENINPFEVEEAIKTIKEIHEIAVIGLDDEQWGQKVVAVMTLNNTKTFTLDDIKSRLKGKIADFKLPKDVIIVDELPKTTTGKIRKQALKNLYS